MLDSSEQQGHCSHAPVFWTSQKWEDIRAGARGLLGTPGLTNRDPWFDLQGPLV